MRTADAILDLTANWLCRHPRVTCALLCAGIVLAGQADARWLA
ncbi:hypothetical protein J2X35_003965 [Mesorhizobium sp. BE184]|nr:hypothetical protein [Mesorhizobium sp. BE184]